MKTNQRYPKPVTYKIKQSIYDAGTNLFIVEYYDPTGFKLATLAMYIPDGVESDWIFRTVNDLYDRFTAA